MSQTALEKLRANPRNPRTITPEKATMLRNSLEKFGDLGGIVLNVAPESGQMVGGHQRVEAFRQAKTVEEHIEKRYVTPTKTGTVAEGYLLVDGERFAYREVHWDGATEMAANLSANQQAGEFDYAEVERMLAELQAADFDLDLTMFDNDDRIEAVAEASLDLDVKLEEEATPDVKPDPGVVLGDLYQMGIHRLACGSCTDETITDRLFERNQASLMVTDPPYGVSYADKNSFLNAADKGNCIQDAIENDHLDSANMRLLWKEMLVLADKHMSDKASFYIFSPQGPDMLNLGAEIEASAFKVRHILIWVKNNHVLGRSDYFYKHEPIFYGWKKKGTHAFTGKGQCNTSVWHFQKPMKNDLHPTMKPVELVQEAIANHIAKGDIVYEPFAGSGSTLIACEKLGAACYAIEQEPRYVRVILDRWEQFTGQKAVKL